MKLTGLEPGKYCLRLYKVTKEHGSSYDAWVRMGAPERMNRMERAMLCHSADSWIQKRIHRNWKPARRR